MQFVLKKKNMCVCTELNLFFYEDSRNVQAVSPVLLFTMSAVSHE